MSAEIRITCIYPEAGGVGKDGKQVGGLVVRYESSANGASWLERVACYFEVQDGHCPVREGGFCGALRKGFPWNERVACGSYQEKCQSNGNSRPDIRNLTPGLFVNYPQMRLPQILTS